MMPYSLLMIKPIEIKDIEKNSNMQSILN